MKIGKIISIEYDKFRVKLFHTTRNSTVTIGGRVYYFGNIGSYLKVANSLGEYVLCEVISIVDKTEDESKIYGEFNLDSSREIIIKPIGTLSATDFNMGIGVFPSLYSDAEIVTFDDFNKILKPNEDTKNKVHSNINVGTSKSLISYNIKLDLNRLFNIHTAILGNTGSGKSTTIAHILQEVYRQKNYSAVGAKTIIFDANGEYPKAFSGDIPFGEGVDAVFYKPNIEDDKGTLEKDANEGHTQNKDTADVMYKPFHLPYYLMNLDEWLAFLMASERTQKPFWDRVLQECYKFYKILGSEVADDIENSVNYIKWKLYLMLNNIVMRVDSDTSKMTAAKGVIAKIKSICNTIKEKGIIKNNASETVITDLDNFLTICDKLCFLNYGSNSNSLSNALIFFVATNNNREFVCITPQMDKGAVKSYDTKIMAVRDKECFRQIDEPVAIKIEQNRLNPGEYFDSDFLMTAVEMVLLEEEAKGNLRIREYVSTLTSRLDYFLYNPDCKFMRKETYEQDGCQKQKIYKGYQDYLDEILGISNKSGNRLKQLITIDSSEVGTETLELMTTVLSRMIFDYRKTKRGDERQKCPVHLILDEAHRYIHKDTDYFMRENIFEKIAREGRKYSLYLIVSSQRPSELSQTVLSQCGNYIVHRIQNEADMKYIYSVLPYFSEDYVMKIKQAVPGEALIFGNCVPMPLMVNVTAATPAPNSANCDIREEWFSESR